MPKIVNQSEQRAAVLRATWSAISEFGIAGVTIRRIADHAGVSTGFISHYFRDKQEVLAEALRLVNQQSQDRLARQTQDHRGLYALRRAVEGVLPLDSERNLEWLIWLSFWGQAAADPALERVWKSGRRQWRDLVSQLLEQAKEDGQIHSHLDIPYETDRLIVLVVGLGMHGGNHRMRARARRIIDDHVDSLACLPGERTPAGEDSLESVTDHA